jgi:hypothetical protein
MLRTFIIAVVVALSSLAFAAPPQSPDAKNSDSRQDKSFDVRSSVGDVHVGKDADAAKAGLPLYPGAKPRHDEKNGSPLNFGLLTSAFGMKLVVAKYDSEDSPGKVIEYYRQQLKKYGKVLECHTREHDGNVNANHLDINDDDKDSRESKELKCEGDNAGPVTELKVGTEDHQHVVAIEPHGNSGSTFALVYLHLRGKEGDI